MKKVKFSCSLDNVNLSRNGEYRIKLVAPYTEIAQTVSLLSFLNSPMSIVVVSQGEKINVSDVWVHKLDIDRHGESKITLSMDYQSMGSTKLSFFGACQQKPIVLGCKGGQDSDEE